MLKFADTVDLNLDMVFGEDMMMMAPYGLFIFVACKALKPFFVDSKRCTLSLISETSRQEISCLMQRAMPNLQTLELLVNSL